MGRNFTAGQHDPENGSQTPTNAAPWERVIAERGNHVRRTVPGKRKSGKADGTARAEWGQNVNT